MTPEGIAGIQRSGIAIPAFRPEILSRYTTIVGIDVAPDEVLEESLDHRQGQSGPLAADSRAIVMRGLLLPPCPAGSKAFESPRAPRSMASTEPLERALGQPRDVVAPTVEPLLPAGTGLVPRVGIEPTRGCPHWILSPARLPVPPPRLRRASVSKFACDKNRIRGSSAGTCPKECAPDPLWISSRSGFKPLPLNGCSAPPAVRPFLRYAPPAVDRH
jgi:hypothetical protein